MRSDDGALAITATACLHRSDGWDGGAAPLVRHEGNRQRRLLFFVLSRGGSLGWEEEERGRGAASLRQVVEAHGHADVAGKADVDAEVDQPLSPCT